MDRNAANSANNSQWNKYLNAVLLFVLLACVAPKLYSVHQYAHVAYKPHASILWSQPTALDNTFSTPVANNNWRFDFVKIEQALWSSKKSVHGVLQIDSDTLKLLDRANSLVPSDLNNKESERLKFLIAKSLPDRRGSQLALLLMQYREYQQHLQSSVVAINNARGDEQLRLLKSNQLNLSLRQERYFGSEIAEQLFAEKNITTRYLNQRRIISMNNDITTAQKKERLDMLKSAYKTAISSTEND